MIKLIRKLFNNEPGEKVTEEGKDYIEWMLLEGKTWSSLTNLELIEMRKEMNVFSRFYNLVFYEIEKRLEGSK
jgi:hypothetical protein